MFEVNLDKYTKFETGTLYVRHKIYLLILIVN